MKKLGSILLSILFALALLNVLLFGITKKHVKPSIITDLASECIKPVAYEKNSSGLFYPEEWNVVKTVDYTAAPDIDFSNIDLQNLNLKEIINTYGKEYGFEVDEDFISEVLSDPETENLVNEYTGEILSYMTGATDDLNIDPVKLEKVVNKTIDKYEAKTGEVIDRSGLSEVIDEGIKTAVPDIKAGLDEVKEENADNLKIVKQLLDELSLKNLLIFILICVALAVLIFVINRNIFITFRYISIPEIVVGFLLFIIGLLLTVSLPYVAEGLKTELAIPENLINGILKISKSILFDVKISGIVTDLIGVVLCVLGFTLYKKENKEIIENK